MSSASPVLICFTTILRIRYDLHDAKAVKVAFRHDTRILSNA